MKYLSIARLFSEFKRKYKKQIAMKETYHEIDNHDSFYVATRSYEEPYIQPTMYTYDGIKYRMCITENYGWQYVRNITEAQLPKNTHNYYFIEGETISEYAELTKDFMAVLNRVLHNLSRELYEKDAEEDLFAFLDASAIKSDELTDEIKAVLYDTTTTSANITMMKHGLAYLNASNAKLSRWFEYVDSCYYTNRNDIISMALVHVYTQYADLSYEDIEEIQDSMGVFNISTWFKETDRQLHNQHYSQYQNLLRSKANTLANESMIVPVSEYFAREGLENPTVVLEMKGLSWD